MISKQERVDMWKGMPEFSQTDGTPFKTLRIHFRNAEDVQAFAEFVGQKLTLKTKSIWYPEEVFPDLREFKVIDES